MKSLSQLVNDQVRVVGRDQFGRPIWQFGTTGRKYAGKNARQRAFKQGYAKLSRTLKAT